MEIHLLEGPFSASYVSLPDHKLILGRVTFLLPSSLAQGGSAPSPWHGTYLAPSAKRRRGAALADTGSHG